MRLYKIALRNVLRHKARSILSGTAISIAAFTIVFLFSMLAGLKDDLSYNIKSFSSGDVSIRGKEYDDDMRIDSMLDPVYQSSEILEIIDSMDEVIIATERIHLKTLFQVDGIDYFAIGQGVDIEREKQFQGLDDELVIGTLPEVGKKQMLMTRKIGESSNLLTVKEKVLSIDSENTKETAYFFVGKGRQAVTLSLTGIIEYKIASMNGNNFIMPIEDVKKYIKKGDVSSEILVKIRDGVDSRLFATKLSTKFSDMGRNDLAVRSWKDGRSMYSWVEMAETIYFVAAFMFFIIGSVVIVNTTIMVIFERMKEIGTLAAMGFEGGQLILLFFLEALFIGIIGSSVGVLLGLLLSYIFSITGIPMGASMDGLEFDMSSIIYTRITWFSTVGVFFYSIIVAALSTFIPSIKAARIKPVEALRTL